jgi:hypothetical protein
MNSGMMRWKPEPLKCSGTPLLPLPFSPVHSARKLAAVLGTTSSNSSNSMRPAGLPPIDTSKNTLLRAAWQGQGRQRGKKKKEKRENCVRPHTSALPCHSPGATPRRLGSRAKSAVQKALYENGRYAAVSA